MMYKILHIPTAKYCHWRGIPWWSSPNEILLSNTDTENAALKILHEFSHYYEARESIYLCKLCEPTSQPRLIIHEFEIIEINDV